MKKFAALFPGQGSQSVGMGQAFAEQSALAQDIFAQADRALNFPLSKLCLEGPADSLTLTQNAQPAILTVSYIAFAAAELQPAAGAGHSLGEYTALVAAKSISFDDAVALVHKRGCYMQEAVPAGKGKMAAIMGGSDEAIAEAIAQIKGQTVEVANYNSPGQTVVAGSAEGIDEFGKLIAAAGAKVIPLNVSAPFHCSLMAPAAERLAKDLDAISFSDPIFPIYSNVEAMPIASGAAARELLKKQVTSSVRWTESMQNLVAGQSVTHTVEFGSGGVLSKLMKRIVSGVERLEIADPAAIEKVRAALA